MAKYGIKVDYYFWNEEKDEEYTSPCFLYTDRSPRKILIFDERADRKDIDLRTFASEDEANAYIKKHGWEEPQCCFENARVVTLN